MATRIVHSFAGMVLAVLAGDLLYLYTAGGWYDPSHVIEIAEIVLLSLLVPLGVYVTVANLRRL